MKDNGIYMGFDGLDDLIHQFEIKNPLDERLEILIAAYDQSNWTGTAVVIYRIGKEYYLVEGSHCSCYGLEHQWVPQEITLEYIQHRTKEGGWSLEYMEEEFIENLKSIGLLDKPKLDPSPRIIKQAIKDWNLLALAIHKFKTIDDVIESAFDTSNFDGQSVEISYKSICTTAFECNGFIALSTEVECDEGDDYFNIDLMRYTHPVRMLGAYRDGEETK